MWCFIKYTGLVSRGEILYQVKIHTANPVGSFNGASNIIQKEGFCMRNKRGRLTFFDVICLLLGRIVFWGIATIIVGCIIMWLAHVICKLGAYLRPIIIAHPNVYISLLVVIFLLYIICNYLYYHIRVLTIDGHRVILRKKIF